MSIKSSLFYNIFILPFFNRLCGRSVIFLLETVTREKCAFRKNLFKSQRICYLIRISLYGAFLALSMILRLRSKYRSFTAKPVVNSLISTKKELTVWIWFVIFIRWAYPEHWSENSLNWAFLLQYEAFCVLNLKTIGCEPRIAEFRKH